MKTQKIGYVRVSTLDQNPERQLVDVHGIDRIFTDLASGKDTARPELHAALNYVRDGDTLIVHSMDRLARNVEDILRLVRELNAKGVTVQFMKENMIFSANKEDPRSMLMFTMLSAFAQFERSLIRERQREGIAIAKAKGVYKGRPRMLTTEQVIDLRKRVGQGEKKSQLAEEFGISRETVYRYLSPEIIPISQSSNKNG